MKVDVKQEVEVTPVQVQTENEQKPKVDDVQQVVVQTSASIVTKKKKEEKQLKPAVRLTDEECEEVFSRLPKVIYCQDNL
jgi:hypothetical protein